MRQEYDFLCVAEQLILRYDSSLIRVLNYDKGNVGFVNNSFVPIG